MTNQLTERRMEHDGRGAQASTRGKETSSRLSGSNDALRQALSCLETASASMKRGGASQTDEVLNLLRAATAHLQQAVEPQSAGTRQGAE